MEQTAPNPIKIRRTRQEITQLLREFDKSQGMTAKDFCQKHQITEGAFYSARKRQASKKGDSGKPGFIALQPPAGKERSGVLFAEVKGIKLFQAVPAEYLKTLAS